MLTDIQKPDEAQLDEDWPGWDEWTEHWDQGMEMEDTKYTRKMNPDGFTYDCCGKTLRSFGCVWGAHRAADGKRPKYLGVKPEGVEAGAGAGEGAEVVVLDD